MKRVVLVLLFVFIFIFSSFDNVSAASNADDNPGFFGKIWGFFKWLFFGEEDVEGVPSSGSGGSSDSGGGTTFSYGSSGGQGGTTSSASNNSIQISLYGPSQAEVNENLTFTGSVSGIGSCTLLDVPVGDCASFVRYFTFSLSGTYPITLAAGGETKTITLVVVDVNDDSGNESGNYSSPGLNESIELTLNGPTLVQVDEPAIFTGSVVGADVCTLYGRTLNNCSSFSESFTFNVPSTYAITLSAGENTTVIMLVVTADNSPENVTTGFNCTDIRGDPSFDWIDFGLLCVERCVGGQTWGPVSGNIYKTYWDYECGPDVPGVGCLVDVFDQGFMGASRVPTGSIRHYMKYQPSNDKYYYFENECSSGGTWIDVTPPGFYIVIEPTDDYAPYEGYFPVAPYDYLTTYDFYKIPIAWSAN